MGQEKKGFLAVKFRLGYLQLKILRVLWERGSARVGQIHAALGTDHYAYTTIATMLRKMEASGLVHHREENRHYIYFPVVSESQVKRSATADFVERIFKGSLTAAVCHLLETQEISPNELKELERLIAERKKTSRNQHRK